MFTNTSPTSLRDLISLSSFELRGVLVSQIYELWLPLFEDLFSYVGLRGTPHF